MPTYRRNFKIGGTAAGLSILIFVLMVVAMGSFTASESSWVLSQIFHKAVHLDWFWGAVLNLISGGWAITFDVIVAIVRLVVCS